ncbi:putative leucine-rich repeat receptor-like protein kinase [Cinnamomum micranthum f. kanehirae]|uniref:Putative leucine-rich repeat receptor-like protein kinase n=1 Tax=Cinnamomum micranthum f. kanehirae TaxID=337451 RepID=A0A443Q2K9_9MAGN|nr:putative leucine-rich repeat receptor-like protein kinase [Cinnamomum micranthum f. kanehirae]
MGKEFFEFDWMKRANVVQSVAHALSYMHMIATLQSFIVTCQVATFCWIWSMRLLSRLWHSEASKARFIKLVHTCRAHMATSPRVCLHNENFGVIGSGVIMGKYPGELVSSLSTSGSQGILLKDI